MAPGHWQPNSIRIHHPAGTASRWLGSIVPLLLAHINGKRLLVDLSPASRCPLADDLACHPPQYFPFPPNDPGVPHGKLGRLVGSDNHNDTSTTVFPIKWKLTRTLVVEKVSALSGQVALDGP